MHIGDGAWKNHSVLVFLGVEYISMPGDLSNVTIAMGDKAAREALKKRFSTLDEDQIVFELIEDGNMPRLTKTHIITADSVSFSLQ